MAEGSIPPPFLRKTYQLVEDPATNHIVSWGRDHTTFVVWRPSEFSRDLLPAYFKHSNFSSFVRQLNTYGFRKTMAGRWEFGNEFFRKGEKRLLRDIHRRKSANVNRSAETNSGAACGGILSEENQRLRRNNSALLSELVRMRTLYTDILSLVRRHFPMPLPVAAPSAACGTPNASLQGEGQHGGSSFKLFGVPLCGKKRLPPAGHWGASPPPKRFKSGLSPRPPSGEAPS